MNKKAEEVVKLIGDALIKKIDKMEDYDIEYDEDGWGKGSISVDVDMEFSNSGCEVDCYVECKSGTIEVNVYGYEGIHEKRYKDLSNIGKAVTEYVEENLDIDSLYEAMQDDYRDANADEWESHGFRDAADYYHWRYG